MNFIKSKTFAGAMSILLAALIAFVAIPMVNKTTRATRNVVRINQPIAENVQITADLLSVVEVGSYNLPADVISDPNAIVGKFAATNLLPTDNLVPTKFKDYRSATDEFLYEITNENLVAISVTVGDLQTQVSGKLQKGDIVSVYVVGRDSVTGEYGAVLHDELKYMQIDALVNSSGEDTTASDNKMISSVVFSCTESQARKLITLQSTGALYLVHVGRGEDAIQLYESYSYNTPGARVGTGTIGSVSTGGGTPAASTSATPVTTPAAPVTTPVPEDNGSGSSEPENTPALPIEEILGVDSDSPLLMQ